VTAFQLTAPPVKRKRAHVEDDLQCQVFAFLRLALPADAIPFAVPNGGFRIKAEAARLRKMGVTPGVADLAIIYQFRIYFIELKTIDGTMSPDQKEFERRCAETGVPYAIVRSVEGAERRLQLWNIPLRARCAA
jgi:hypothetical protein